MRVTLMTGGFDRPYAFGLSMALSSKGVCIDVIGSDQVDSSEMHSAPNISFLNLHGGPQSNAIKRVLHLLIFYGRLICYALLAKPQIFHILWNNKLGYFDRTLLMLYYKLLGKKIVLTAHNVNAAKRDARDSLLNRFTLRAQYRLANHIFVHTEKMRNELLLEFGVSKRAVSVIPFGINNSVPVTDLTPLEAKRQLGIATARKVILFFGAIRPYKGLEYLVRAFGELACKHADYLLIVAGERKKGSEEYLDGILQYIARQRWQNQVTQKIEFIPDEETELYFKAADVLVLPYVQVFQSGVLFLAYSFGLPVIASNVGSFRDEIVDGKTGFVCRPRDSRHMATVIEEYFESDLYGNLEEHRPAIQRAASAKNSWDIVAEQTCAVYTHLLTALQH